MKEKIKGRKIVIVNQAVNYLTVGIANSFAERFDDVSLITGNIHTQGEELNPAIHISPIARYSESSKKAKFFSFIKAFVRIYFLLATRYRRHEVFFVSVPPFGYISMLLLWHRFSVLVWDVYPDAFKIYGFSEKNLFYRFWAFCNRRLFKRAYRLFTIGGKMAQLLSKYTPIEKLKIVPLWTCFDNYVQVAKSENVFVKNNGLNGFFIVQYSGNIGATHNVEILLSVAKQLANDSNIKIVIIGKGERLNKINEEAKQLQLDNVTTLPFQSDEMFPYSLAAADVGVVVLDDQMSKGSVPSKTYNLMAAGVPLLYISSPDSELAEYAGKYKNGQCFNHNDVNSIAGYIRQLSMQPALAGELKKNSLQASKNFRRSNADDLVEAYI